jgi:hypothetical protein
LAVFHGQNTKATPFRRQLSWFAVYRYDQSLHQQVLSAPQVLGFAPAKMPWACDFERWTILSVLRVSFEMFFFMALVCLDCD